MAGSLFGTDGVRGCVGDEPVTPQTVLKLGWAAGSVFAETGMGDKVLIGKDTRVSGYMLESALEAGFSAAGIDVSLLGPMPTPGIAYLTRTARTSCGVVISASHNPYHDNGIKFFSPEGMKLDDALLRRIEEAMERPLVSVPSDRLGKAERFSDAQGRYIEHCKGTFSDELSLAGLKIVIDCANGAAYDVAPRTLSELGAEVIPLAVGPDGFNINDGCGSTHPGVLQATVVESGADLGIALDGDADRVLLVDHAGNTVNGDQVLYVLAAHRHRQGRLPGGVVGTVLSNLGLEQSLQKLGIAFDRADVGDRYVQEKLLAHGWLLGGEASGHLICLDKTTTGDGLVAALEVLEVMLRTGAPLRDLVAEMAFYPQHTVNVPVANGRELLPNRDLAAALAEAEQELGDRGRVVLRPSGTEHVFRVMVEGDDDGQVHALAGRLADRITEISAA